MNDSIQVIFDTSVYAVDAIKRAVFRQTGDFYADIRVSGSTATVELRHKTGALPQPNLADVVRNDVIDEMLRARVRSEAASIHEELIRATLRGTLAPKARP